MSLLAFLAWVPGNARAVEPTPEDPILGVVTAGVPRAYPESIFEPLPVLNDMVGTMAVVVFLDRANDRAAAYFRLVAGEPLEFSGEAVGAVADDLTTNTRWDLATGLAVSGNLAGMKLIPIPVDRKRLAEWRQRFPRTTLFAR